MNLPAQGLNTKFTDPDSLEIYAASTNAITLTPRSARRRLAEGRDKNWLSSNTINPSGGNLFI